MEITIIIDSEPESQMETTKTATPARQKLLNFYDEVEKSDMAKNSISQIRFALMFATDEQVQQFVEWLFMDEETPDNKALADLNAGRYNYLENFGQMAASKWEEIEVEIVTTPDEERSVNIEDEIFTVIDKEQPFGLDANSTCVYYLNDTKSYYVSTDFEDNGNHGQNTTIAKVNLTVTYKDK